MLIALALAWFLGTVGAFWALDRRAAKRAEKITLQFQVVIDAIGDCRGGILNNITPLYEVIDPVKKLEASVKQQGSALALFPAAMEGLTTKIQGIFETYEEHALAPDADVAAPLVMSRIERHRQELDRRSQESLDALNKTIAEGGHAPPMRVRGDE